MNKKVLWVLGLFLWQAEVLAEGQKWSTVGGKTVGRAAVIDAGVGWPGLHMGLAYGVHTRVDIGFRFSFNWGVEGSVRSIYPGIKLQALLKGNVFDNGFLSFALKFEPGFLAYFYSGRSIFHSGRSMLGFALPLGAQLGLAVAKPVIIGIHLELPMFLTFGEWGTFQIPLLMGGGVEYFFTPKFLVNFVLKMGPSFNTDGGGTIFVMEAKLGVAYRF
ncbi:MAG: hypothetical protein FWC28_09005 [Proteobacteria bacterium]|nr:hypothetical protein [Cystobacterineae bacterium]MCL2315363.1 hypothetical protein [Pseudomonadota bacterium]